VLQQIKKLANGMVELEKFGREWALAKGARAGDGALRRLYQQA
jgi:hypothetical protein